MKFKTERGEQEHEHEHIVEKPFVCGICGKGFTERWSIRKDKKKEACIRAVQRFMKQV